MCAMYVHKLCSVRSRIRTISTGLLVSRKFVTLGSKRPLTEVKGSPRVTPRLPVLGDIKSPLKLKESVIIIIDEAGGSIVVATM